MALTPVSFKQKAPLWWGFLFGWTDRVFNLKVAFDVATTGSMSYLDVRDQLPLIDPENLSPQDVLTILLHLFQQQPGFVDRGHEVNNKETAWVNGFLFRLLNDAAAERLSIEEVGSSVDKISALR